MSSVPGRNGTKGARRALRIRIRKTLRPYWVAAFSFSIISNVLLLVSPIYMLQIYDRVMTSASMDTLIWLSVIAVFLMTVYAAAEGGRRRVLSLAADRLGQLFTELSFRRFQDGSADGDLELGRNLADTSRVQQLYMSSTLTPFLDIPFTPLFILVMYIVHPLLGYCGIAGGVLMLIFSLLADRATRERSEHAAELQGVSANLATSIQREWSSVAAMGLGKRLQDRYFQIQGRAQDLLLEATGKEGGYSALIRSSRQMLQILMLGLGAGLALSQEISSGSIVAGTIVLSRALAPVDQIVGSWRSLTRGREAWRGLMERIPGTLEDRAETTRLPRPEPKLVIDRLACAPRNGKRPLVHSFNLTVEGGCILVVTGVIGAGKTTLLETLAGALGPHDGAVSLGGRTLHEWPAEDRGRYVGYVPQRVNLFQGTVMDNVTRFGEVTSEDGMKALQAAGAMPTVLGLPDGPDTNVGPHGVQLSAGQRQLIGFAEALSTDPVLLLLDEPTANLDATSAMGLIQCLRNAAASGAIVIAATHDWRVIRAANAILNIQNRTIQRKTPTEFFEEERALQVRLAVPQRGTA